MDDCFEIALLLLELGDTCPQFDDVGRLSAVRVTGSGEDSQTDARTRYGANTEENGNMDHVGVGMISTLYTKTQLSANGKIRYDGAMFRPMPKPTKTSRPGEIRRRAIENAWPKIRDDRKRELQLPDGNWICYYCDEPIYTWEECVMAHVEPKGREPAKKLCRENLMPSHAHCNVTSDPNYRP